LIFVTVGTQLAFDRLVLTVDEWAGARPDRRVFAQVGPTDLRPHAIEHRCFISPSECRRRMSRAEAVVAHAGMGTILGALEQGKPVIVMPRRAALGEHRNDHQLATARRLANRPGIAVAFDEDQLAAELDRIPCRGREARRPISPHAPGEFTAALRDFLDEAGDSP